MSVVPLRWQGALRTGRIAEAVCGVAERWRTDWAIAGSAFGVQARPRLAPCAEARWHAWRTPAGEALVDLAADTLGVLGCALGGTALDRPAALAAHAGRAALEDLLCALLDAPANSSLSPVDVPPRACIDARHGAVRLDLTLGPVTLACALDARACDHLVPRPRTGDTLHPVTAALGATDVALEATLELGTASLLQVQNLRPGEIVKTDCRLDAPLVLRSINGDVIARAQLVETDGHRGLRIANGS